MNRQETGNMEVGDGTTAKAHVVIRETETGALVQVKTILGVTRGREGP